MNDTLRDQAKAIREQAAKKPELPKETARQARWRVERERAAEQARREPHKGY